MEILRVIVAVLLWVYAAYCICRFFGVGGRRG